MKRKIHMIGNAHLDPVWLWKWQEGYAEVQATFRSALDRMKEFDDFIFCCAGAQYYKWVEENDPAMFNELRERVSQGRWCIVGGWWIQPDCNMPDGETFVRHSLYGQRYFREKFGFIAKTGYNVDSFGHNPMLPQILKKSGMDNYVFMRPFFSEKPLPYSLFRWEAPDGSNVLTYRIPITYTFNGKDAAEMRAYINSAAQEVAGFQDIDMMCFFGVGNHGGGPTIQNIKAIYGVQAEEAGKEIIISDPDSYFDTVRQSGIELPTVHDSLQIHAPGCYATMSEVKRLHRKAEQRLNACEKMLVLSKILKGTAYPIDKIGSAWENILFNSFHDILCGCSIKEAYDDVYEFYGETLSVSGKLLNGAVQRLSWNIDTMPDEGSDLSKQQEGRLSEKDQSGVPVVVFNPHAYESSQLIKISKRLSCVEDHTGNAVAFQSVADDYIQIEDKCSTNFLANIPPYGYAVYWIYKEKQPKETCDATDLHITEDSMENRYFRLDFNKQTASVSIYDKINGMPISDSAAVPIVIEDTHFDTWAHGATVFNEETGRFSGGKTTIIDSGPLVIRMLFETRYAHSVIKQIFTMVKDNPQIDVSVYLNWQQEFKRLKLGFAIAAAECECTYDIPYGFLRSKPDEVERPCQKWTDITGKAGGRVLGLTVLNDSKYSFSAYENELRLTGVRSPLYADHVAYRRDSHLPNMDMGVTEFRYALLPHNGHLDAFHTAKTAKAFCTEQLYVIESCHKGDLPQTVSGLSVKGGTVIAEAIKRAEEDDGYIMRLYEASGAECQTVIDFSLLNVQWKASFGRHEIKTFRISDKGEVKEVNLLEL